MADGLLAADWLGPVDFLVVELPEGGVPRGVRALMDLVTSGTLRVLDLEAVRVTDDGVVGLPLPGWGDEVGLDLHVFDGAFTGLLDDEDLHEATLGLSVGTSALVLVYEVLAVRPLVAALLADGARVLAEGPVVPSELVAALDQLEPDPKGGLTVRLLRTAAHVGVATSVNAKVQRRQAQKWAVQDQAAAQQAAAQQAAVAQQAAAQALAAQQAAAAPPVPAAPQAAAIDPSRRIELLKEFAQLRDAGVLTQAEFDAQKAQLLS